MNYNILGLLKNINLSSIISGTSKTLNVVKKSIPVYREIRPYIRHEKSLFKSNKNTNENDKDEIKESKPLKSNKQITYNDSLTFFN